MKIYTAFFILLASLLTTCKQKQEVKSNSTNDQVLVPKIVRYGMVTGVKAEKLEYYKSLHANPWPAVMQTIRECNIKDYSIYLRKIGNDYFLFSYFEYTGNNFDRDMKKMAADTATQRWWRETSPCQQPLPDAAGKGETWSLMEEVFHLQ